MLRDKALIPLSHQHHNALALCVRIERSFSPQHAQRWAPGDPQHWQQEIERLFQQDIQYHFGAEEQVLFPAARAVPGLSVLVDELVREHAALRQEVGRASARQMDIPALLAFAGTLSTHVRKEEQNLFQAMQNALSPEAMVEVVLPDTFRLQLPEVSPVPCLTVTADERTQRLQAVLGAYALIRYEHHGTELSALFHRGEHVDRAQRQLRHFIRDLLVEGAHTGHLRNDIAPDELASYCLHALTAATSLPSKAAVRRLVTVTLAGLRPPAENP
jgi:hemerythrin-like domain-containing protein